MQRVLEKKNKFMNKLNPTDYYLKKYNKIDFLKKLIIFKWEKSISNCFIYIYTNIVYAHMFYGIPNINIYIQ